MILRPTSSPRPIFSGVGDDWPTVTEVPGLGVQQAPALESEPFDAKGPVPSVGVVIGSYMWPTLIDLQICIIRDRCGQVPILVSDDCSPGFPDSDRYDRLVHICASHYDVMLWPNGKRIGHTGGDLQAYRKGVLWGVSRQMDVVVKISQRFIVDRDNWIQELAQRLLNSKLPLACRRCKSHGVANFDLRTECAALDVQSWNTGRILDRLTPRRYWGDLPDGLSAETVIYRILQDELGGQFYPLPFVGEERYAKYPGVLWHMGSKREDYDELAKRYGIDLEDLHSNGWSEELKAGSYLYG